MSKHKNIKEYCDAGFITVDELKEMILTTALNLGCEAAHNFEENPHQTEQAFTTLYFFNDLLDTTE